MCQGRSCEEHVVCGSMLEEDMVVRLRKVQVLVGGARTALRWRACSGDKVFSVDVVKCNREERHLFYSKKGCCQAAIISSLLLK
jgi:hypothetical protein